MEQLLKQFGFSDGETIVYKSLLKSGGAKVSEIADQTKLKRTTCQEYVQSLEKKGFINSAKLGNKYYYQAEDPDKFRQIINERQFVLEKLITKLKQKEEKDVWDVQTVAIEEIHRDIRRAKRKEQEVIEFGNSETGGTLLNGLTINLFSDNKEIPALKIKSKDLYNFHKNLFERDGKK